MRPIWKTRLMRQHAAARRRHLLLLTAAGLLLAVAAAPAHAATDVVPGQLVVGFKSGVSASKQKALIEKAGGRLVRRLAHIRGTVVHVKHKGLALSVLRRRLAGTSGVRYAEPDYYLHRSIAPNDPDYSQQYALAASGAGAIGAPVAWNTRTNCAKVAVLDTGTQYNHPDLTGNVWHNPHEIAGNNVDDDKNGYIDDYYGVDLVTGTGTPAGRRRPRHPRVRHHRRRTATTPTGVYRPVLENRLIVAREVHEFPGQGLVLGRGHRGPGLRDRRREPRSSTARSGRWRRSRARWRPRSSYAEQKGVLSSSPQGNNSHEQRLSPRRRSTPPNFTQREHHPPSPP